MSLSVIIYINMLNVFVEMMANKKIRRVINQYMKQHKLKYEQKYRPLNDTAALKSLENVLCYIMQAYLSARLGIMEDLGSIYLYPMCPKPVHTVHG